VKFLLGGPAYNHKIDVRHAGTMAQAIVYLLQKSHELLDIHYVHNSVLPQGRAQWLQSAIDSGADVAITMDADTWLRDRRTMTGGECLVRMAYRMIEDARTAPPDARTALVGVLVPQRNNLVNAWRAEGERLRDEDGRTLMHGEPNVRIWDDVFAVGLACAIYNLEWWRPHRDNVGTSFGMMPTGVGLAFVGEDVWHSEWIRSKGGRIVALDGMGTVHGGQ